MTTLLSVPNYQTGISKILSGATATPDSIVNNLKGRGFMKGMDKATVLSKRNQDVLAGFEKVTGK
ncbi:hypothetical protein [Lactiplantibacillus plantarum]|uniref:hypothetical protein n=1 Tax=Lactiplantibacillus plantarum TaxID=1590 RepID=UPI0007B55712|nr:hypothetical protein [Lactiplantibacillus plantarum]KZU54435.1 hypothetical protein Nizo2801_1048 [Lactiplantibacillus plantarum]